MQSIRRGLVTVVLLCFLLINFASPVLAEVCDKVAGENWQPSDGALMPWLKWVPIQLLIAACLILPAWKLQMRRTALAVGCLLFVLGVWVIWSWSGDVANFESIWQSAIKEGSVSQSVEIIHGVLICLVALVLLFLAKGVRSTRTATSAD